jgi:hypothetical protein
VAIGNQSPVKERLIADGEVRATTLKMATALDLKLPGIVNGATVIRVEFQVVGVIVIVGESTPIRVQTGRVVLIVVI